MVEAIGENYPGNSYNAKTSKKETSPNKETEERKPLDKVISGEVVRRKKGFGAKIKETFTGDDPNSVGSYVFFEVVVPAIKATLSDAVSQGVERMLFGTSSGRSSANRSGGTSYTPYNRMSRPSRESERPSGREVSSRSRATHNFDEIILDSRGEAEEVLDRLTDLIRNFGVASVSDLYDLVGISKDYTDDNWGWTNLREARVRRIREGCLLELPATEHIS